jgi:hypothetical protein
MKFLGTKCAKILWLLFVLPGPASGALALDREAFSITNYDLNLAIDADQHRLAARGTITLRNDSSAPEKIAVLQISSSLDWRSIALSGKGGAKPLQFVRQPYTSDLDHTGSLSEAIVTLPEEIAPHSAVALDIAYEGVIVSDATRLTRIGTPGDAAITTDWDRIDDSFTGLRGAGHVAWYPIATEVANLSEDNSLFEVLARWKDREAGSKTHLQIQVSFPGDLQPQVLMSGLRCGTLASEPTGMSDLLLTECMTQDLSLDAPALVIAHYQTKESPALEVHFLPRHEAAAANFAAQSEKIAPFISDWFGPRRERARVADLPDSGAAPFESGGLLLMPLGDADSEVAALAAAHQLTHVSFLSFRPWIEEGLAHFAQALYLEHEKGRQAALDYMGLHRSAFTRVEPRTDLPRSEDEASRALVNTLSEELYRSKAMCVWWMLRDMIGDAALKKAIAAYRPQLDKDPAYMPRLISAETQRDLEWFFDDWVYRDRGLPDFKVESAFARKTMTDSFMLTITLDNLGTSGAEVPVIIKLAKGEVTRRMEVRAKSRTTVRVETPSLPQEIRVNDGSVPESDLTNNTWKVDSPQN